MRTRTPPDLKWLLVERATIAGDIQRLQATQAQIASELANLQTQLEALDSTLALAYSSVRPDSAGAIQCHGRYGKRGALKAFIVATVQNATPASITTLEIAYSVVGAFGLSFATKVEFQAFTNNSIKRQILLLKKEGLVEALHNPIGGAGVGTWRWKTRLPTLVDLSALA